MSFKVKLVKLNTLKNKINKISREVVTNAVEITKSFFNKLLFENQNIILEKDTRKRDTNTNQILKRCSSLM